MSPPDIAIVTTSLPGDIRVVLLGHFDFVRKCPDMAIWGGTLPAHQLASIGGPPHKIGGSPVPPGIALSWIGQTSPISYDLSSKQSWLRFECEITKEIYHCEAEAGSGRSTLNVSCLEYPTGSC